MSAEHDMAWSVCLRMLLHMNKREYATMSHSMSQHQYACCHVTTTVVKYSALIVRCQLG